MKHLTLFILIFIIGIISACEKKTYEPGENRLLHASKRGRGMFSCHIGGSTYNAKRQKTKAVYNESSGYLFIESNFDDEFDMILFRLFVYEGVFSEGVYSLDNTGEEVIMDSFLSGKYEINDGLTNQLEITKLKTKRKVVSGYFQLNLINPVDSSTLSVTDGRFDLPLEVID